MPARLLQAGMCTAYMAAHAHKATGTKCGADIDMIARRKQDLPQRAHPHRAGGVPEDKAVDTFMHR